MKKGLRNTETVIINARARTAHYVIRRPVVDALWDDFKTSAYIPLEYKYIDNKITPYQKTNRNDFVT